MPQTGVSVDIPTELLKAAHEQRVCPFIGAGFTKNVDARIPSAVGLNEVAADCLEMDAGLLEAQSNGDYQLVAEYLISNKKFGAAVLKLDREFHSSRFDVGNSEPHLHLARLKTSAIFTTNWDHWIEKAFSELKRPIKPIILPSDYVDTKDIKDAPFLFKLHGDVTMKETLVYSISSYYERMANPNIFDIWLSEAVFNKTFLFVGYSFYDPNLRLLWYRMKTLIDRARLLDRNVTFPKSYFISTTNNKLLRSWLHQIGIDLIVIDGHEARIQATIGKIFADLVSAQNS